tara:strand:- start:265 stop:588 length:324 start_codon:yes stop_codon:yes gene_type:complete
MAKKPVFMLALRNLPSVETAYTPLMFTRGTLTHKLALVKRAGTWQVCDIGSGALVLRVKSNWKGIPVESLGLTLAQARECALVGLDTLVDRVGLEKFERVLSNPKPF